MGGADALLLLGLLAGTGRAVLTSEFLVDSHFGVLVDVRLDGCLGRADE